VIRSRYVYVFNGLPYTCATLRYARASIDPRFASSWIVRNPYRPTLYPSARSSLDRFIYYRQLPPLLFLDSPLSATRQFTSTACHLPSSIGYRHRSLKWRTIDFKNTDNRLTMSSSNTSQCGEQCHYIDLEIRMLAYSVEAQDLFAFYSDVK